MGQKTLAVFRQREGERKGDVPNNFATFRMSVFMFSLNLDSSSFAL